MIKINKDLSQVPASLNSDKTQQRRQELVNNQGFINKDVYNSRYKMADIKEKLEEIYQHKCAFCEKKIEEFDVEHFRPKSIYYWLAYSWDNLLMACGTCNTHKNNHFETLQNRVSLNPSDLANNKIHQLAHIYDDIEQNSFIHPELEDIEHLLIFEKNGEISSNDNRVNYTIEKCEINRDYLVQERKTIWDKVWKRLQDRLAQFQKGDKDAMAKIKDLIEIFKEDAENSKSEYLAFRRYCVKHFLPKTK
jgi:uncharacterized protein (TIGR02646 family)